MTFYDMLFHPISLLEEVAINDRKLFSQIEVLIEDKELVDSFMGGKPWKAGKFALSLRLALWSEHLGLNEREVTKSISC